MVAELKYLNENMAQKLEQVQEWIDAQDVVTNDTEVSSKRFSDIDIMDVLDELAKRNPRRDISMSIYINKKSEGNGNDDN